MLIFSGVWIWRDVQNYETISKWVETHQTFTAGIAGAIVMFLGVSIAWWQLNSVRRTRYAQLLLHLNQVWDSDYYVESRSLIDKGIKGAPNKEQAKAQLCKR